MSTLIDLIKKLKFEYSSLVAQEPRLAPFYRPVVWWQKYKAWYYYSDQGATIQECDVDSHTEFILDGFQGSANSFAADAFKQSQKHPVLMAHHMHAPVQIIKGVRRNIPTLVTIREPKGAVLSLTSRWPYVAVRQALRSYIGFYGRFEPHVDDMVLSPFEITTRHLGTAIMAVNKRFRTDFDIVTDEAITEMRAQHGPAHKKQEEEKRREAWKAQKTKELCAPSCKRQLRCAEALHQRLLQHALNPPNSTGEELDLYE